MKKVGFIAALVAVAAAAFACSSSSGGGGSCPAAGYKACPNDQPLSATAASACNACSLQYSAYVSGDPNATKVNCDANGMSVSSMPPSNCASQFSALEQCALTNSGSGSGGGSGSGSGSSSGGGSGSGSGGTGNSTFSCVVTTGGVMACEGYTGPSSEVSTYQQSCTSQGGTAGTGCPSASLVGCCKTSTSGITSEACYYDTQTGNAAMMGCTGSTEMWSTSP